MSQTHIRLNDNTSIPQVGLGVFQATNGDEVAAVKYALAAGYRHIDTAAAYHNEEGVGQGVKASGIPRDQIYITSKIWNDDIRKGRTTHALNESLKRLDTDYLDLILLHWPADGRVDAWRALIAAQQAGKARSIGVSNFTATHLDELVEETGVVPAVNQIEYHPYLTQPSITAACEKHGIAVEAWSPLMQGHFKQEPVFQDIAKAHGKTDAQVLLRWDIQRGVITIPKSVNQERLEANFDVFDFSLSHDDMARINALERNRRFGPDPENFKF